MSLEDQAGIVNLVLRSQYTLAREVNFALGSGMFLCDGFLYFSLFWLPRFVKMYTGGGLGAGDRRGAYLGEKRTLEPSLPTISCKIQ